MSPGIDQRSAVIDDDLAGCREGIVQHKGHGQAALPIEGENRAGLHGHRARRDDVLPAPALFPQGQSIGPEDIQRFGNELAIFIGGQGEAVDRHRTG